MKNQLLRKVQSNFYINFECGFLSNCTSCNKKIIVKTCLNCRHRGFCPVDRQTENRIDRGKKEITFQQSAGDIENKVRGEGECLQKERTEIK